MASVFTDQVLLFFVAALLGSSFLLVNGKSKDGAEGTLRMLDGSLAFTITGILASGWTWVIYNDMVRNPLGGEFCATEGLVQCGLVGRVAELTACLGVVDRAHLAHFVDRA